MGIHVIKSVLVAVDGSENSVRALDFALDLADRFSAGLVIVNVSEPPAMGAVPQDPSSVSPESLITFSKDLDKIHQGILEKAVTHAKQVKPELTISSKLREGEPANEIISQAKESASDIIIIGHKGVGRVKEFLGLGGISEKVVHLAPCAVVIVR